MDQQTFDALDELVATWRFDSDNARKAGDAGAAIAYGSCAANLSYTLDQAIMSNPSLKRKDR